MISGVAGTEREISDGDPGRAAERSGTAPCATPSMVNVTVPVGTSEPVVAATVAVKLTELLKVEGFGVDDTEVEVVVVSVGDSPKPIGSKMTPFAARSASNAWPSAGSTTPRCR